MFVARLFFSICYVELCLSLKKKIKKIAIANVSFFGDEIQIYKLFTAAYFRNIVLFYFPVSLPLDAPKIN